MRNSNRKAIAAPKLRWLLGAAMVVNLTASQMQPWPWSGNSSPAAVNILIAGDVNIQQRPDPASAFVNVRETLARADLVYANLEGLLVKSEGPDKDIPEKKGWTNLGADAVVGIKAGGIQVVGCANNVAYGRAKIMKSLAVLDAAGIPHCGAGQNIEKAHEPVIAVRKGIRIGFLQYSARWYVEDRQVATNAFPGIARILSRDGVTIDQSDQGRFLSDIRRLRPLVDVLVVCTHNRDGESPSTLAGVTDPKFIPLHERDGDSVRSLLARGEPYQKVLSRAAIDAGADIVLGTGSHVLQGVEVYRGKAVFYCLADFVFDWSAERSLKEGLLVRLVAEGRNLSRVSFVPVSRDANNNAMLLDPATGEGASILKEVKDLSGNVSWSIAGKEVVLVQKH
jgi:poly-gamma-glutamate capsule biosynthesis protein CapA/YwtB (metallophosphatase superfamily)